EDLFEGRGGVADGEAELVARLQERMIEPSQGWVGDAHLDPVGALDAVGVGHARDAAPQRRGDGLAVDDDLELGGQRHQTVTSPVEGSVNGNEGTWSVRPTVRSRGSSRPLATAIGRHRAGFLS